MLPSTKIKLFLEKCMWSNLCKFNIKPNLWSFFEYVPGLHMSWLHTGSWFPPDSHACSCTDEPWSSLPWFLPGSCEAWSWPRSLAAPQLCSGPRPRPVIRVCSCPERVLFLPDNHVWSRSPPGPQSLGFGSFQLWSWGWERSLLPSGWWDHESSLEGSVTVGGAVDPGWPPLARSADDITEQLVVGSGPTETQDRSWYLRNKQMKYCDSFRKYLKMFNLSHLYYY